MKLFSLSTIALGALLVPTSSIAVAEDTPSSSVEDNSSTPEEPECYTSLSDVYDRLENHYKDNGEMNTFVVCPNTVMDIGFLKPGVGIEDGQSSMIPRPNTEFLCGHDGKSSNNCVLEGGDFGLIMVPVFFSQHRKVENVTVSGFTFRGQKQYAIFAASQGDLEVSDCIFEDATTFAPVVFNYNSSLNFPKLEPGEETRNGTTLDVRMKDCTFRNLRQHEPRLGVEAGIVNVKGADNVVTMQNCLFVDNHYGNATAGYAIQAENATVVLENNCFIGNEFRGTGAVLVVGPNNNKVSGNFATEDPHLDCALGAAQDGDDDFECLSNDQADACNIDWYVGNNLQDKDVVQSS